MKIQNVKSLQNFVQPIHLLFPVIMCKFFISPANIEMPDAFLPLLNQMG